MELREVRPAGMGFKMLVSPDFYHSYLNNIFEHYTLELLSRRLLPGTLFLDIGAHYGIYSISAGVRCPDCKVIAFEPSPMNYDILKKNVALNGLKNIAAYDLAVSDRPESREFQVSEQSDNSGFYGSPYHKVKKKIPVNAISIDQFIDHSPAVPVIVKIDVEGHEISVLEGMKRLSGASDEITLLIEFNPDTLIKAGRRPEDLLSTVDRMGFEMYTIDDEYGKLHRIHDTSGWESHFGDGNYKKSYFNILCVKEDH